MLTRALAYRLTATRPWRLVLVGTLAVGCRSEAPCEAEGPVEGQCGEGCVAIDARFADEREACQQARDVVGCLDESLDVDEPAADRCAVIVAERRRFCFDTEVGQRWAQRHGDELCYDAGCRMLNASCAPEPTSTPEPDAGDGAGDGAAEEFPACRAPDENGACPEPYLAVEGKRIDTSRACAEPLQILACSAASSTRRACSFHEAEGAYYDVESDECLPADQWRECSDVELAGLSGLLQGAEFTPCPR